MTLASFVGNGVTEYSVHSWVEGHIVVTVWVHITVCCSHQALQMSVRKMAAACEYYFLINLIIYKMSKHEKCPCQSKTQRYLV